MIVLLPISTLRVTYEVGVDRPYSALESAVLSTIVVEPSNLDRLEGAFGLHRRLLVEAVVTLVRAGRVMLDPADPGLFLATAEGIQAAGRAGMPPWGREMRGLNVVVEELEGSPARSASVTWSRPEEARRRYGAPNARVVPRRLNGGKPPEVLLKRCIKPPEGEWLRMIGDTRLISAGQLVVPVAIDLERQAAIGLPAEWIHLTDDLISFALRYADDEVRPRSTRHPSARLASSRSSENGDRGGGEPDSAWVSVPASAVSFACSKAEHFTLFREALERATTTLVASSAFLTAFQCEALSERIEAAAARGVQIDLLWGYEAQPSGLELLRALKKKAERSGPGRVRVNIERGTGSHAKVLLWDEASSWTTVIGSYNWLSAGAGSGQDASEASAVIQSGAVLSSLGALLVDLWRMVGGPVAEEARKAWGSVMSGNADAQRSSTGEAAEDHVRLRLVVGRDHDPVLRDLARSAQVRVGVCSHRLAGAASPRLNLFLSRAGGSAVPLSAAYGDDNAEGALVDEARLLVERGGGVFSHRNGLHAKTLVSDDRVYLGSYNWLSTDAFGTAAEVREAGVLIEHAALASRVWDVLHASPPTSAEAQEEEAV